MIPRFATWGTVPVSAFSLRSSLAIRSSSKAKDVHLGLPLSRECHTKGNEPLRLSEDVVDETRGSATGLQPPNGLPFSCRERAASDNFKKGTISRAKWS